MSFSPSDGKKRIKIYAIFIKTSSCLKLNKMAALENSSNGQAVKGRTKKPVPRVDLTAMVDLAFLLITFFMLTTSLAKKNALDVTKTVEAEIPFQWPASRTMTILLGKNNQAVYYLGEAKNAQLKSIPLSRIKREILFNKRAIAAAHTTEKEKRMLVIIKPTASSLYRNFVDILDEMNINKVETYAIDDKVVLPEEQKFMKLSGI
jgi:biopolymer transport protein ExbD